MRLKLILSLGLAGAAVLFVAQNVALIEVRFLFWSLSMTLAVLILLLFASGLIVGWLLHSYWSYGRKSSETL
jgi:lipopolysaccharide assembly protein A